MLFAHIETGYALDVQENVTAEDYLARFTSDVSELWTVSAVPTGTQSGAKSNGDGTYTNPDPPPNPAPKFAALDKSAFQALYAANGNDINSTLAAWPFS